MSIKERQLKELVSSRNAYRDWVTGIKVLTAGINVDKADVRINPTECPLHQWLTQNIIYIDLKGDRAETHISTILEMHNEIFTLFHKIYDIYFGKGLGIGSFFGKKISENDKMLAEMIQSDILKKSDTMLQKVQALLDYLKNLDPTLFSEKQPEAAPQKGSDEPQRSGAKVQRYYRGQLIED